MIIEWYTIIFQIINFMVLVFLLRHFLYRPIIRAMDDREQKIVQREKDAAAQKEEAVEELNAYRQKNEELEQREEEILEEARTRAEKKKRELLEEARREVDESRRRWEEAFEREKETFISELRLRIGRQACSVARRCLEDLADARLEELTWDLFLEKIESLPEEERSSLQEAFAGGEYRLTLRSAFEAPAGKEEELKERLQKILPGTDDELKLSTETDPSLVCGLELEAGGYRVAWSVDSYLEGVEEQILKELEQGKGEKESGEVNGGEQAEDGS